MRRAQVDSTSQNVRNNCLNPSWNYAPSNVNVRTNLAWNSSFEVNLNGWTGAGVPQTVVTRSNEQAKFGSWSAKCECTAFNNGLFLNTGRIVAVPGEFVTLSAWAMGEAGKQMTIETRFLDSALAIVANKIATYTTADGLWQRLWVTSNVAPANTAYVDVVIRNAFSGAQIIFVDGVLIEKHNVLFDYFDGSFASSGDFNYTWSGTAHQTNSNVQAPLPALMNTSGNAPRPLWQSVDKPAGAPKFARAQQLITGAALGVNPVDSTTPGGVIRTDLLWVRCSRTVTADLRYRDPTGAGVQTQGTFNFIANQWQLIRVVGAPSFANAALGPLFATGKLQAGDTVDLGPHMSVEGVYDGDYIDGSKEFCKWFGLPHQSASVGYPPQLMDYAGKAVTDISVPGTHVLGGGFTATEARTIYTVYANLLDIPDGTVPTVLTYGSAALSDTVPNSYITLRQQAWTGDVNFLLARRTGGAGAGVANSRIGFNVAAWGITSGGTMFNSVNAPLSVASDAQVMNILHERLFVPVPNANSAHVRTLVFRGYHSDATRQAVMRYLGNKYGANVA